MTDELARLRWSAIEHYAAYENCAEEEFDERAKSYIAALESLDEAYAKENKSAYERGVTAGFDEAIYEVKRGEIDPQTYQRKS
jgi:hypothetical protein